MAASKLVFVLMVMVVAAFQLQTTVAQTRHVVGDALGWTIPPAGAYTTWAANKTFTVGDSLIFNFTTGAHDVAEVTQAAYGPCTVANPITTIMTGPATVMLTAPGNHYYICTFGTHCQIGQKLTINVAAATSTPPSASSPAPTGSTMPPPPPPPSAASPSFTAVVPATLLAAAVAFFY
ncbi:hypothetical protein L1887_38303 [Cichorium endivia]|nr:hypothetical protein L1887_38303 [Cichorium endivia]